MIYQRLDRDWPQTGFMFYLFLRGWYNSGKRVPEPILVKSWASVAYGGPALRQHCPSVMKALVIISDNDAFDNVKVRRQIYILYAVDVLSVKTNRS